VMRQMEEDLGTGLDWVAVNHFNTGHPHSHVVIRGRDDLGKDSPNCCNRRTRGFDREFACWPATRACRGAKGSGSSRASRIEARSK
jgi:hypothetical protein